MKILPFNEFVVYFISCSEESNPVNEERIHPISNCSLDGLEIEFVDTCKYDFIISFLSTFDSVSVVDSFLGSTFYFYAESGDTDYWQNYFENDSSIQFFTTYNSSDSLILKIRISGKYSEELDYERFLEINNLEFLNVEKPENKVYVLVPENTETQWSEYFEQYEFISNAYVIGVCVE